MRTQSFDPVPKHHMEEVVTLCEEYVNGGSSNQPVKIITSSISEGKADILHLIKALGIYLTSTNVDTRGAATKLLSSVLGGLDNLLPEDVHYLVEFYCDRLKDRAVILPHVLTGLHTLVTSNHGRIEQDDVVLVFRTIFKEVHCQALQFEERLMIFNIFHSFLLYHLSGLVEYSAEFVMGYIQVLDGERDPRNLLLAFSSVPIISQNLQFDLIVEDFFDVISCYFPIDFTPPPSDPTAVTREALVVGLRRSLSSSPLFAEMCVPLLLEKLSSDVHTAKLDSLHTLIMAIPPFGARALAPFIESLWATIKTEMFKSANKDIQFGCVAVVRAMALSLSHPSNQKQLESYISLVLKDCQRHLNEPELKLMEPVVHLLCGITMSSDPAAHSVISAVLPNLLQQYSGTQHVSYRPRLLDAVQAFVKSATVSADVEVSSPLVVCKAPLLEVILSALTQTDPGGKKLACSIFSDLLNAQGVLDHSEIIQYSQKFKNEILGKPPHHDLQECFGSALRNVSKRHPDLAKDQLLSPLVNELQTDSSPSTSSSWLIPYLAPSPDLASHVLPPLITALRQCSTDLICAGPHWHDLVSISDTIQQLVEQNAQSAPILTHSDVGALLRMSLEIVEKHWKCCSESVRKLMVRMSSVLAHNARYGGDSWWDESIEMLVDILFQGSCDVPSHTPASLTLPILTAMLATAPPTMVSKWGVQLTGPLLKVASSCDDEATATHAAKACASILNKIPDDAALTELVEACMGSVLEKVSSTGDGGEAGVVRLWIWLTKALLMRGHPRGLPAAHKLLDWCTACDDLGARAADGFRLILSSSTDVLCREGHAVVKLFYKQQLFVSILPKLMELVSSVEERRKKHLLRVLSHLMSGVPQQVVLADLPKVLPLFLECLSSPDVDVRISTLAGILSIMNETPSSFSDHLSTLFPLLLSLAKDQSSMVIRRTSLQCIHSVTSLPPHLVYPHQRKVIRGLSSCLDDHKRLVRKAAVDTRAHW